MADAVMEVDVAVVGSGAAGLSAALSAAARGADVVILEKSDLLGGTSAMSGGGTWIPCNHLAREAGIEDSPDDAMRYLRAASPEGWSATDEPLWQSFVDHAPAMIDFLEAHSELRFQPVDEPDPMAECEGGKPGGRQLTPSLLNRRVAGPYARLIRRSTVPQSLTYSEIKKYRVYEQPVYAAVVVGPRWLYRMAIGQIACGQALVAGLLGACQAQGCRIVTNARVEALLQDSTTGRVEGLRFGSPDKSTTVRVRQGVVLATGGFEWDSAMLARHFAGPVDRLGSPNTNTGDGQKLAAEAGASMERMDQANVYATLPTRYEGAVHGMPAMFHASPHCIAIDRNGERFVSEYDYNIGEALDRRDPETGEPLHLPAWLVGDRRFLNHSMLFRLKARLEQGFLVRARTLTELSSKIGVPPDALAKTVERFNGFVAEGRDPDFRRGESVWERYMAGHDGGPGNPALGAIETPPFVACRFNRSILGTKGGARTNAAGQVVRPDGTVIGGLYCAGNAMANPFGTRAVGSGTTIGPCLTWGYICGLNITRENIRPDADAEAGNP
ncbi:MAG: FAD-dependent oxidoreductase [Pseudomonadota bacterium]